MLAFGVILMVLGIGSTIYGFYLNNSWEAQLKSLLSSGNTDPGTIWIIVGIVALIVGIILLVVALTKKRDATSTSTFTSINSTDITKKKCPHCSALIDDDAFFCSVCGRDIREKITAEKSNTTHFTETEKEENISHETTNTVSREKSNGFSVPTDLD